MKPKLIFAILVVTSVISFGASLQQITNFGNNPSNIKMYVYVPDKVVAHPPILVCMHWCHGTAQAIYTGTDFAKQADKYGFIIVYPNANSSDSCWDVHSTAALTHNGGSDPSGIVSMVHYAVQNLNGDSTRVYATGHSSGGMMTDVMLGSYPDVFKAGSAFASVPFACFAGGTSTWNTACANGTVVKTAAQWGDLVRAAYPGYTGPRPRIQFWHGSVDATLSFKEFPEEQKEWSNVFGLSQTPTKIDTNAIQSTWIRSRYADSTGKVQIESIQETGQPHNLMILADSAVNFLGLNVTGSTSIADRNTVLSNSRRTSIQAIQNGRSSLRFVVSTSPGLIRLDLCRLDGSRIQTITEQRSESGSFQLNWNGKIKTGGLSSTGVYMVLLKLNGHVVGSSRIMLFGS